VEEIGGLAGNTGSGTITRSYSTANVFGSDDVGGFVGENNGATISKSYATGDVSGSEWVGGFVGLNGYYSYYTAGATISQSYASGAVSGTSEYVGGFVGANVGGIKDSYASGNITERSATLTRRAPLRPQTARMSAAS
jgi:hypothetical protein